MSRKSVLAPLTLIPLLSLGCIPLSSGEAGSGTPFPSSSGDSGGSSLPPSSSTSSNYPSGTGARAIPGAIICPTDPGLAFYYREGCAHAAILDAELAFPGEVFAWVESTPADLELDKAAQWDRDYQSADEETLVTGSDEDFTAGGWDTIELPTDGSAAATVMTGDFYDQVSGTSQEEWLYVVDWEAFGSAGLSVTQSGDATLFQRRLPDSSAYEGEIHALLDSGEPDIRLPEGFLSGATEATTPPTGDYGAYYLYLRIDEGSGELETVDVGDLDVADYPGYTAARSWLFHWEADGSGYGTLFAEGGGLSTLGVAGAHVELIQCWDTNQQITFAYTAMIDTEPGDTIDSGFTGDSANCPATTRYTSLTGLVQHLL